MIKIQLYTAVFARELKQSRQSALSTTRDCFAAARKDGESMYLAI